MRACRPAPGASVLADVVLGRLADFDPVVAMRAAAAARVRAGQLPRRGMSSAAGPLPRADLPSWNRAARYYISRLAIGVLMHLLFRIRVEGRANLPAGPVLLCFNHLNWIDPFLLYATLPLRPRLYFFGPKEADLRVGTRNRLMRWTATPVPFKPAKTDLLDTTRRVQAVFGAGGRPRHRGGGADPPRRADGVAAPRWRSLFRAARWCAPGAGGPEWPDMAGVTSPAAGPHRGSD